LDRTKVSLRGLGAVTGRKGYGNSRTDTHRLAVCVLPPGAIAELSFLCVDAEICMIYDFGSVEKFTGMRA